MNNLLKFGLPIVLMIQVVFRIVYISDKEDFSSIHQEKVDHSSLITDLPKEDVFEHYQLVSSQRHF